MDMPTVNIPENYFTNDEMEIINRIVKKNGKIRATKPKVKESDVISGDAAYVWRMVVFMVSPKAQHQCMPIAADFDLQTYDETGRWSAKLAQERAKQLDKIVDKIVDLVPKHQQYGVIRWAKALYG